MHKTKEAQTPFQNDQPPSYDDVLQLIDDLETGELEKRCCQGDLEKINHFFANLARQGILPNEVEEEFVLENDIYELLHGDDNSNEYSFAFDTSNDFVIVPAIVSGPSEIILCKSWIKKKWEHVKKFVKKHKKAIIIGAAVVVAAAVVVTAVVAISAASAAAAGAAASDKKEKGKSPPPEPVETPVLQTVIDDQISSFKEQVVEQDLLPDAASDDESLIDKARTLGALLAHEAFEGITELASVIPQLNEEIKEISARVLPEGLLQQNASSPLENYESARAAGHEKIDQAFASDQAILYSQEVKDSDDFVVGILPPPALLGEAFANNKLLEAGKASDRGGLTKAGRALAKHGSRENTVFPPPIGNPAEINEHGQQVLEKILNHPERKIIRSNSQNFGEVVDVHAPGIGGVRFNSSGEMIGFLEPKQ